MTSLHLTLGNPSAVSPVDFSETPSSSASDSSKPNRTSSPSSSRTPSSSTTSSTTSPRTGPSSTTTTSQATSGSNYFPSNLDGSLSGWNFFVVAILLLLAITVLITCLFYKRRSNYEKFDNGKSVTDSESLS